MLRYAFIGRNGGQRLYTNTDKKVQALRWDNNLCSRNDYAS